MGITRQHLKKLGFVKKANVFGLSEDWETLVYKSVQNKILIFLPKGKTVLFYSRGYDASGTPVNPIRLVMLDDTSFSEMKTFLKSLKTDTIVPPKKTIQD